MSQALFQRSSTAKQGENPEPGALKAEGSNDAIPSGIAALPTPANSLPV